MCGATAQQTEIGDEQIAAYKQAQDLTSKQYANQQAIYGPLATQFQSIFAKGPNQTGFSTPELNSLNAQAVEGTATNYSQAAKSVNESLAAEGGGDNPLPSGGQIQLKQQVANSAAQEQSSEENTINAANYSQGYNEWQNAAGGLQSIAAGENPLGYEGAATSSGSAASDTANQIASQQNSWINAAIGAGGTIGGAALTHKP
jgi:hypothetical protein